MAEITHITIPAPFTISPEGLILARQRLPLVERDFVPLMVFDRYITPVEPEIDLLAARAVALSIGRPFGFMKGYAGSERVTETQKTDGIVMSADSTNRAQWHVILQTERPLTETDIGIFAWGINHYAGYAERRLRNTRYAAARPPKPSAKQITDYFSQQS